MNTLYAKFKCTEIYVMHMICKKKKKYIYIYIYKEIKNIQMCI